MQPRPDTAMSHAVLPPYFVRSTLEDIERLPAIHPSVWVGIMFARMLKNGGGRR